MYDIVMTGTGGILQGNMGAATVRINQEAVLDFNGSSDYISIADHNDFSFGDSSDDSAFSVSAWVKAQDLTNFPVISKGEYNVAGEWALRFESDDKLYFILYD